ncbi:MAG: mycofactocin oligosaccharide methyltransferase MftM [Gordonia sp. (in: high G+C Gram-positive bacteria)]|uniref:mycofactocin oligosaccharide methyltransferase MftM n=1 Tax=Gordonia sp. (in: high G+C Gram-positive bacteria) TaxID=84139 RepID=UPI003C78AD08
MTTVAELPASAVPVQALDHPPAGYADLGPLTALTDSSFCVRLVTDAALDGSFTRTGRLRWRRAGTRLELVNPFTTADLSDESLVTQLSALVDVGAISGREEFEACFVALVTGTGTDRGQAWHAFYANSVRELRAGTAEFSPVHQRARSLLTGTSVLEVGCCFGLFALQCAQEGFAVTATDICPGALDHLDDASRNLGLPVRTALGDARTLPFTDNSFDTVTLLHLLEHLESADVERAISEACRVASARVVIAVPYEPEPSPHFGHLELLREEDLVRWSRLTAGHRTTIFADHGGWLVIDLEQD